MARERNIQKAIIVAGDALDPFIGSERLALFNEDGSPIVLGEGGTAGPQGEQGEPGPAGPDNSIWGHAIPEPGADQDGWGFVYDYDTGAMVWVNLALKSELDTIAGDLADHIANIGIHSSGREIDYSEITANFVVASAVGGGTVYDVPGLDIEVPAGDRPVTVEVFCAGLASGTAGGTPQIRLYEGTDMRGLARTRSTVANAADTMGYLRRRLPASGSDRAFKVSIWGQAGHALTFTADPTTPAHIQAREC